MNPLALLAVIVHTTLALLIAAGLLCLYRWMRRQSAVIGWLVAIAILLRAAGGLTLFLVSYFGLPVAQPLQAGGGFWGLAIDATAYYANALGAIERLTLFPLDHSIPSPFYVDALTVWMLTVGPSPIAGMFLNLCLYVCLMALLVRSFGPVNDWRRDLPCLVAVAAYSFSPAVLLHSTQPLKDELSLMLVGIICLAVLELRALRDARLRRGNLLIAAVCLSAIGFGIYGISGVRWYLGVILIGALGAALTIAVVAGLDTPRRRYLGLSLTVLLVGCAGFRGGAHPYYNAYLGIHLRHLIESNLPQHLSVQEIRSSATATLGDVSRLRAKMSASVGTARTGFLASGGATNIVLPIRPETDGATAVSRAMPHTRMEQLRAAAIGLGVMTIPMSVLKTTTGIEMDGGRGLLWVVDFDTLFVDVGTLAMLLLVWTRRSSIRDGQTMVLFCLILGGTIAILLGYVVTNFGTLWRMRPLAALPIWIMAAALSPSAALAREVTAAEQRPQQS
jgi:hypothetical protein